MGSTQFFSICPRCGFVMDVGYWYHSDSYLYNCSVCGWHASKMIYYECNVHGFDDSVDIDGYCRSYSGGYGVVRTDKVFGQRDILVKKAVDEKIKIAEGRTVLYETWCEDDKPIKIQFYNDCSDLEDFRYVVFKRKNNKVYVSMFGVMADDMLPREIVRSFDIDERYIEAARLYENILYDLGIEEFFCQVLNRVRYSGHFNVFPECYTVSEKIKAKYCAEYKKRTGEDFDFEKRFMTPFKWREHMFFAEHKDIDRMIDIETEIDVDFEEIKKYVGRYIDYIDDKHKIIVGYDNTVDKALERRWNLLCKVTAKLLCDKILVLTNDAALSVVENTLFADCKFYENITQRLVSDETRIRELYCQDPFIRRTDKGVPYVPDISWCFNSMIGHGCRSDFGRALYDQISHLKAESCDESYIADCNRYLVKLKEGKWR